MVIFFKISFSIKFFWNFFLSKNKLLFYYDHSHSLIFITFGWTFFYVPGGARQIFFHPFLSGGGTFKVLLSKCHLRYLTQKNITFFCPFLTEKIRIFEKYFGKGLGRDYLWPTLAIRVAQSKQGVYFLIHLSVWKKPTW